MKCPCFPQSCAILFFWSSWSYPWSCRACSLLPFTSSHVSQVKIRPRNDPAGACNNVGIQSLQCLVLTMEEFGLLFGWDLNAEQLLYWGAMHMIIVTPITIQPLVTSITRTILHPRKRNMRQGWNIGSCLREILSYIEAWSRLAAGWNEYQDQECHLVKNISCLAN